MIYTVTFNPSLDYVVHVPGFTEGIVNRAVREELYPGGKGINVSLMLRNLGVESMALGFIAGSTGDTIVRFLQEKGCRTDFITLPKGMSRINVKLKSGQETEVNGQGPHIPDSAIEALYEKHNKLKFGDVLVLGGSIPKTLPSDMYERILARLYGRSISVAVDATGELLLRVLKYHPFLIKPNEQELAELCCRTPQSDDELVACAKELQAQGARNVLLSLAERGGLLVTEQGEIHRLYAPYGETVNSVGAGDSMVAGFLAGFLQCGDYYEAFRTGIAAGSATAFSEWIADEVLVRQLMQRIK